MIERKQTEENGGARDREPDIRSETAPLSPAQEPVIRQAPEEPLDPNRPNGQNGQNVPPLQPKETPTKTAGARSLLPSEIDELMAVIKNSNENNFRDLDRKLLRLREGK